MLRFYEASMDASILLRALLLLPELLVLLHQLLREVTQQLMHELTRLPRRRLTRSSVDHTRHGDDGGAALDLMRLAEESLERLAWQSQHELAAVFHKCAQAHEVKRLLCLLASAAMQPCM